MKYKISIILNVIGHMAVVAACLMGSIRTLPTWKWGVCASLGGAAIIFLTAAIKLNNDAFADGKKGPRKCPIPEALVTASAETSSFSAILFIASAFALMVLLMVTAIISTAIEAPIMYHRQNIARPLGMYTLQNSAAAIILSLISGALWAFADKMPKRK